MKLLFCPICKDIFSLSFETKFCSCKKSSGKYLDNINAEITGGIPLGFENRSFVEALRNQPENGLGYKFEAFVIPKECDTIYIK